jgi:hypothetical protein
MDEEDRKDIIKKINTSGDDGEDNEDINADNQDDSSDDSGDFGDFGDDTGGGMPDDTADDEEGLQELSIYENLFLDEPKRNEMFQPKSNDYMFEDGGCWHNAERVPGTEKGAKGSCRLKKLEESEGLWANIHAKHDRGEAPAKLGDKGYPDKKTWDELTETHENMEGEESPTRYMFFSNLEQMRRQAGLMLDLDEGKIEAILNSGHDWAADHIAEAKNNMDQVFDFLMNETKSGDAWKSVDMEDHEDALEYDGSTEGGYEDEYGSVENINLNEAKYQGRKVKLGKPTKGDSKKFKVYVKNSKGNVVKVNFGDPKMEIKRDNPKNKKSFRARHKCSQAKDRTTPKYWSCKMWSSTPVSKIVGEDLKESIKSSIFDKKYLTMKIQETFKHAEPMVEPQVKPQVKPNPSEVKPNISPSRRNKPFTIEPNTLPKTDPKASK